MRLLFAFVTIVAAVVLARADDHPLPLSSRPTPQLKLNASIGWRSTQSIRRNPPAVVSPLSPAFTTRQGMAASLSFVCTIAG